MKVPDEKRLFIAVTVLRDRPRKAKDDPDKNLPIAITSNTQAGGTGAPKKAGTLHSFSFSSSFFALIRSFFISILMKA